MGWPAVMAGLEPAGYVSVTRRFGGPMVSVELPEVALTLIGG